MKKKPKITEAYRTAGDDEIYAMRDEETGVSITVVQRRSGPFALNWRGILWGVLLVSLLLALLPLLFWLGERVYHLTTLLPKTWQPFVQALTGLLAAIFVIYFVILHPLHMLRLFIGAGKELVERSLDWRKRSRDRRDPHSLDRAVQEINTAMGWKDEENSDESG